MIWVDMTIRDSLQRPLSDLRVSVTDRCNLRCGYCMPAGYAYKFLPRSELLTFEEITRLCAILARLGLRKVRLTGGEPLLRRDLDQLVAGISAISQIQDIALTTNGLRFPALGRSLKDAGLSRVTFSLDSLSGPTLKRITRHQTSADPSIEAIQFAQSLGLSPIKVNMVVQRGVNDHEIPVMADTMRRLGVELRFIEFMDVGTMNGWSMEQVVAAEEILTRLRESFSFKAIAGHSLGDVAKRFEYDDGGVFGVITSVSQPFCGNCSRLRLSAEGQLYTCLFATGGFDVRGPLRSVVDDNIIEQKLISIWRGRQDRYSELRTAATPRAAKVEMYQIGG